MPGNIRYHALNILHQVESGGFAGRLMDSALDESSFSRTSDRGLLRELVLGILRNRLLLDHLAGKFLRKPIHKTDRYALNGIRMGIYQILFLTRMPHHAAIYETVEAVKKKRGKELSRFVNGVLRSFSREMKKGTQDLYRLEIAPHIRYSFHPWMVDELKRYGEGVWEDWLPILSSKPPLYVRRNPFKAGREELEAALKSQVEHWEPHPLVEDCYSLEGVPPLYRFPPFLTGMLTPQDSGSIFLTRTVASIIEGLEGDGGNLLDACAAPGIKSSYLSNLLPSWNIMANDISRKRLEQMEENFSRLGVKGVETATVDLASGIPLEWEGAFNAVFVDAPCSGLGVSRRNPEAKWRISRDEVRRQAGKGLMIAENALSCLKSGGILLYSTCTFTEEENEGVVKALYQEKGCVVKSVRELIGSVPDTLIQGDFLVTVPHYLGSDFFFLAALEKNR